MYTLSTVVPEMGVASTKIQHKLKADRKQRILRHYDVTSANLLSATTDCVYKF